MMHAPRALACFAALALLPLGACAMSPPDAPKAERSTGALPAPTPIDAGRVLTAADDGASVSAQVGERLTIALVGVPTAGYVWAVSEKPAFLSDPVEGGGPTSKAQLQPGFTGGNHWEVFTFTVTGGGEGDLVLAQRRPWETTEPPMQTYRVRIQAP